MSITKKMRFEVLKRDEFKCRYCGSPAPDVFLEIDHVIPRSKGGKDDVSNLVAACEGCNRGKSDIPLDKPAETVRLDREVERFEQEKQIFEFLEEKKKFWDEKAEKIHKGFVYMLGFDEELTSNDLSNIIFFIKRIGETEVQEAVLICADKQSNNDSEMSFENLKKYFFGVLHNKLRDRNGK